MGISQFHNKQLQNLQRFFLHLIKFSSKQLNIFYIFTVMKTPYFTLIIKHIPTQESNNDNIVSVFRYISFVLDFNENMAFLPCNDIFKLPVVIHKHPQVHKLIHNTYVIPIQKQFLSDRIFSPFLKITILVFSILTIRFHFVVYEYNVFNLACNSSALSAKIISIH